MTLSELSSRLEIPKNAVFRITQTLLARGYLSRDAESMAFNLTGQLLKLAPPRWGARSLPDLARPAMTTLRDETRETVQLGVLNDLEGVIIDRVEGLESLRIVVDLGVRFALHNSAPGKLLLAYLNDEQREAVLSQIKPTANTSRTITTNSALRRECERIVTDGYAVDHAEADEGIHCVAAPIISESEGVVGTLWVSAPSKRLPKNRFRDVGLRVRAAGARVSRLIGEIT